MIAAICRRNRNGEYGKQPPPRHRARPRQHHEADQRQKGNDDWRGSICRFENLVRQAKEPVRLSCLR